MTDHFIKEGKAPEDPALLSKLSVGIPFLSDFLKEQYLMEYIPQGGSKIKFVTGRPGSGKTHFAHLMHCAASELNYLTVRLSANTIWLHDFREIYLSVLGQCDIETILQGCARTVISEMGYHADDIPAGQTFIDYLSGKGEADAISKSAIRNALRDMFIKNPMLDNGFAYCCSLLTGGILGYPLLEPQNKDLLLSHLAGDKTVKLGQLRALGLSPSRVTKYNARHLLRSLSETVHLGGYAGIFITIDDMEKLLCRSSSEFIHYSKLRREDTYESLRQLIDEIDGMRYILFMLCFDRELIDNESYGIKSYQALWMRIQNEVVSTRFNRFADILDLDRFADETYTKDVIIEMSEKLSAYLQTQGESAKPLTEAEASQLFIKSQFGGLGLPYLVNRAVICGGSDNG